MPAGRFDRGGWKRVKNVHGTVAPAGGFAIPASPSFDATHDCVIITRPTADDMPNVLIISEEIPVNGYGIAYESGTIALLWDGAAPAVDDRVGSQTDSWYGAVSADGTHLVRAISGGVALGFFTPLVETTGRTYLGEWARVDSADPTATQAYGTPGAGTSGSLARIWSTAREVRIVHKFASTIPSYSLPAHYIFGTGSRIYMEASGGMPAIMRAFLNVRFITEDFDCSTVTWNSLAALAKTATVLVYNYDIRNLDDSGVGAGWGDTNSARIIVGITWTTGFPAPDVTGVYGAEIYFSSFTGPSPSNSFFSTTTRDTLNEVVSFFEGG